MSKKSEAKKRRANRYATALRKSPPQAEVWFWARWRELGMLHFNDKSNERLGFCIPDVINKQWKYIIEVDEPHHAATLQRERDLRRDHFYQVQCGYLAFRIKAYSEEDLALVVTKIKMIRSHYGYHDRVTRHKPEFIKSIC